MRLLASASLQTALLVPACLLLGLCALGAPTGGPAASQPSRAICLDPGHPSETSAGTATAAGVTEIHLNWAVAVKLRRLPQERGWKVVMTKKAEAEKVTNRRRAEIANAAGAALLLRLHCDSTPARGLAVYYPDRQGKRFGVTGPAREIIAASRGLARPFNGAVVAALKGAVPGRGIHGDSATLIGSKQGALTGSIFAHIPVLTVEMAVLNNAADAAFITTAAGQERMAKALAAGIEAALGPAR